MGQQWPVAGLGALNLAVHAWVLLKEVAINPSIELPHHTQDWEIDSWRAQTESCVQQDLGERSSDPTETDPDLPRRVQESPGSVGQWWPAAGYTECSSTCVGYFEGGYHYLHYLHHSLASSK